MAKVYKTTFLLKRGTLAQWEEQNIVLQKGEPGFATDANLMKIGDGVTPWKDLEPINSDQYIVDAATHFDFPAVGKPNVLYKAHEEAKLYQWNSEQLKYELLTVDVSAESLNITQICGGTANELFNS